MIAIVLMAFAGLPILDCGLPTLRIRERVVVAREVVPPAYTVRFFTTGGCLPCERMKPEVTAVEAELRGRFRLFRHVDRAAAWRANVQTYPTLIVYDVNGVEQRRLIGFANRNLIRHFLMRDR